MDKECKDLQNQINRLKGQVNGISRMIDEKRSAVEIVTQISAVRAGLSRLAKDVLKNESNDCFKQRGRKKKLEKFEELVDSFFKIS